MASMADAVNPLNLPTGFAAIAGYDDGPKSAWPKTSWVKFTQPALHITVLGNPDSMAFDVEPGNAGPEAVALSVAVRTAKGLPSVVYVDQTTSDPLRAAFNLHAITWLDATHWPAPGAYLWCADPNVEPGTVPPWAWVGPVAVQDRDLGTYDLSTLYDGWLPVAAQPSPVPQPTTPKEVTPMNLLQLTDGSLAAKGNGGHLLIFTKTAALPHGWKVDDVTDGLLADAPGTTYTID
jgi:hypothetical protein